MKKISYILAVACGLWAFSSCCADKDPMYTRPAEGSMVLNVPVLQDEYIDLTEGDVLELTTSQPDYGYSAVAVYSAQMSLTEDFKNYELVDVVDVHQSAMKLKQESVAIGYCALKGLENGDDWDAMFPDGVPYETIYFRAGCELEGVNGSHIVSNVVTYNNLKPYFAVPTPGYIYIVGSLANPNNWNINPGPDMRLYEPDNQIGSHIYSGVFDLPAGDIYFRFYTEIGAWGDDGQLPSIGPNANDGDNTVVEFVDGSFSGKAVPGKGSWELAGWAGGEVTMVVDLSDMSNMTVTFYAGEAEIFIPEFLYVLGDLAPAGWTEPVVANASGFENSKIFNSKSAPEVFTGTFTVGTGDKYFRFFSEFSESDGWNNPTMIGSRTGDNDNVDVTFVDGVYTSPYVVPGKGNWTLHLEAETTVEVAVDTANETVVFTIPANE